MIKLNKSPKPEILVLNETKWKNEYMGDINKNLKAPDCIVKRYNHPKIKEALMQETKGKCLYCEGKVQAVSFGDVEHILPKNKKARPDLYVEWNNLSLACIRCNRPPGKGSYYDMNNPIVNPYIDEPKDLFDFIGPLLFSKGANLKAKLTISLLMLNRPGLVEKRINAIEKAMEICDAWFIEGNITRKGLLEKVIHKLYDEESEFSAIVKSALSSRGFNVI